MGRAPDGRFAEYESIGKKDQAYRAPEWISSCVGAVEYYGTIDASRNGVLEQVNHRVGNELDSGLNASIGAAVRGFDSHAPTHCCTFLHADAQCKGE